MKHKKDLAIVPFDKGQGLVSIERDELVRKAEKEFKNVTLDTKDTTLALQNNMQGKLRGFKKNDKFDQETYKNLYPSSSVTPTANPAIKAHKPEKDYPARLITSHIGAPQENVASYLNDILKPFIESNKLVCKNSFDFVERIKSMKVGPFEKMVSYDATALFPSVPISDAIKLTRDLLDKDDQLQSRTKLTPEEVTDLISSCLSSSNFFYNNRHHTQKDSGPIGLSLMVTISQIWMIFTMEQAIARAKSSNLPVPRVIFIYMDDCWCLIPYRRPGLRNTTNTTDPAVTFNDCLNAIHPRVQFTREEEVDQSIAFLDVFVTRNSDGTFSTRIFRKPSNTNLTIKPQSCQNPTTAIACFKGELCRIHQICSSQEQIKKEVEFTLNLFEDNGHNRSRLANIAKDYQPPPYGKRDPDAKSLKTKKKQNNNTVSSNEKLDNLFEILPFHHEDLTNEEYKPYVCIPYFRTYRTYIPSPP